jgi:hypothetical protein
LLARLTLRTLAEAFDATSPGIVTGIVFNGYVSSKKTMVPDERGYPRDDIDQLSSLWGWGAGPMTCTVTFDRIGRFTGLTAALPAEGSTSRRRPRHLRRRLRRPAQLSQAHSDRRGPLSRLRKSLTGAPIASPTQSPAPHRTPSGLVKVVFGSRRVTHSLIDAEQPFYERAPRTIRDDTPSC